MNIGRSSTISLCCLLLVFLATSTHVRAATPITPSGGLNTQVNLAPTPPSGKVQYDITGGTRPGGGTNLFHSFGNFNVPTNNIANFLNDSGLPTSNILGRITGGNPSSIFGMIQTTGFGNANLFLMNPAGFLFGPNATLNVGGMVAFTTADYLRLADGVRFNALPNPAADALLSPAPVAAFGFLGSNPAAIAVQGSTLRVADGQTLSMVGGNKGFTATNPDTGAPINVPDGFTMTGGKLLAPGGQINIASVAGPGEISAVDFMPTPGMTMGNISLSEGALLDVSADAAGTIRIRGGQLVIADATLSADTGNVKGASPGIDINLVGDMTISDTRASSAITARTSGSGDAGEVRIVSANLNATSTDPDSAPFALIATNSSGDGRAGNINITSGNITVKGPAASWSFADSGQQAAGAGGDISITANTINLIGTAVSTGTQLAELTGFAPTGHSGNLTLTADSLNANNVILVTTAFVTLDPSHYGGDIRLNVRNINMVDTQVGTDSAGGKGGITIKGDTLIADNTTFTTFTALGPGGGITFDGRVIELTNGSAFFTNTSGGPGANAGDIHVTATDHFSLIGKGGENILAGTPTGLYTNSQGFIGTQGNAGNIFVSTPRLVLNDGRINASTETSGHGGNVTINAGVIEMSTGFPNPVPSGGFVFSTNNIVPSGIVTQTVGSEFCSSLCGNAGNINITTNSLTMSSGSQINSGTTNSGQGGNITIQASNAISISGTLNDGSPVGVFSRSLGTTPDAGGGGNISLSAAQSVSISNGATASASSSGAGNAGNILVRANDVAITGGGTITAASTGSGNAGTVTIQGLNSPANSFLVDGTGSGVFTTTSDVGRGGNIVIDANAVTLQNGAHVSSSSTGTGSTGNIQISAGNQFAMTNSSVTTEATQSGGGVIKITTNSAGNVELTNSIISASVLDGAGGGGSVNIDPQSVILQNSQILANSVFGPGGNIFITTNLLLPDTASIISASSQFGQQGTISIQSPISPASGKIVPLGQKPLLATSLLSQRCAALAGGNISSFTVAGRDTLPAEPGSWLPNPLVLGIAEPDNGTLKEANDFTPDQSTLLSLRRIAPPGFLTQAFAVESSGCQS